MRQGRGFMLEGLMFAIGWVKQAKSLVSEREVRSGGRRVDRAGIRGGGSCCQGFLV
jgi:hypothetical protein